MKRLLPILVLFLSLFYSNAQSVEEKKEKIKQEHKTKEQEIKILLEDIELLREELDSLSTWNFKTHGTFGGSISGTKNWYQKDLPNSYIGSFGINVLSYAGYNKNDYVWKNSVHINLTWVKYDDRDDATDKDYFASATDILTLTSLFGKKLNKKFMISSLGEYQSSMIHKINDPGYLDFGIGMTWIPVHSFLLILHPVNYNQVFSSNHKAFVSSFGTKILANYYNDFGNFVVISSLSLFQSYKSHNYSNYTWINSFSYTFWRNLGVAFDFGLRYNKQETLNYILDTDEDATFDSIDNTIQNYWMLGIHYKLE